MFIPSIKRGTRLLGRPIKALLVEGYTTIPGVMISFGIFGVAFVVAGINYINVKNAGALTNRHRHRYTVVRAEDVPNPDPEVYN